MLDTKRIIQLGLGVAIGMLAYHFIQKAMNKTTLGGETAGAFGKVRRKPGSTQKASGIQCVCTRPNGTTKIQNCPGTKYTTCEECCGHYGFEEIPNVGY